MLNFLKKRFAVFTAFIYFSAVLVGCSSTRFIVKDYSAYVGNLFSYYLSVDDDFDEGYGEDNDNEPGNTDNSSCGDLIEAEKYVGLVNIGKYKFDAAKAFFGNYAYAERGGKGFLVDRKGNCVEVHSGSDNTSSNIVLDKILYDKLIVKSGEKYGVISLDGKVLLDNVFDRVDIFGRVIIGIIEKKIYVYVDETKTFEADGENVSILSEEFVQIDNRVLSVADGSVAMVSNYYVWSAPSDGKILVSSSSNGSFGYCEYPSGNVLIEPKYFIATPFYNGTACVAEFNLDFSDDSFYGYQLLIDTEDNVVFNFERFKEKCVPTEITVFPRFGNYCVVRFGSGLKSYGAVRFSDETTEYFDLDNEPDGYRFYGDNYIIKETGTLFSVKENSIVSARYSNIEPLCEAFFLASLSDGTYSILDGELNVIAESCESVEAYENTLLICKNSMYAYYSVAENV